MKNQNDQMLSLRNLLGNVFMIFPVLTVKYLLVSKYFNEVRNHLSWTESS